MCITIGNIRLIFAVLILHSIECLQYFAAKPKNTTIREGETTVLECKIGDQAQIGQTVWTMNGGLLGANGDYELSPYPRFKIIGNHAVGEYHLQISDATRDDDGKYECQTQPSFGKNDALRGLAHLSIVVPPNRIEIEIKKRDKNFLISSENQRPSVVEIRANKILDAVCRIFDGKPDPIVNWSKIVDNRLIAVPASSIETTKIADSRTIESRLRILVNANDAGSVFVCKADHPSFNNHENRMSTNFTLHVSYPPGKPEIQGFDRRILKAGERLPLNCKAKNGNPETMVYWYRNNQLIDRSFTIGSDATINEYEFTVDSTDNDAEYKCESSNSISEIPLQRSVKLRVVYPPSKVSIGGPTEGKVGRTVDFTCESSESNPPAKIAWFLNGVPFDGHQEFRIRTLKSYSKISLKLVKGAKDLNVMCAAYNEQFGSSSQGRVTIVHKLNLLYPPDDVIIYGYDNGKAVIVGSTIVLTCVANGGNPKAEITWYKGQKKIIDGLLDPSITEVNSQRPLKILVDRSDNGASYRCLARNAATVDDENPPPEASIKLTVHFPPEKLSITISPSRLIAGTNVDFTCHAASANPTPVINWLRVGAHGSEILQSVDIYNTSSSFNGWEVKNRLRWPVTVNDNGARFTCNAQSPSMNYSINEDVISTVYYKPVFNLSNPRIVNVLENEFVSFNCPAKGNPSVLRYDWSKDNSPLGRLIPASATTINRHQLQKRRGQNNDTTTINQHPAAGRSSKFFVAGSTLNISDVQREDTGSYQCTAFNDEGSTMLTFQLFVSHAATITQISTPVYADAGSLATLECQVDAFPKIDASMIKWLTPVSAARSTLPSSSNLNDRLRKSYSDGRAFLQISDVQERDSGEYTCLAYNGVGEPARKNALLLIKKSPKIDREDPTRLKSAADQGKSAKLHCRAEGVPEITFSWLRESDGTSMDQLSSVSILNRQISPTKFESILNLREVHERDYGFYTCAARNSLAADSLSILLNATSAPDPPLEFGWLNVTSNSVTLKWSAGFDGGLPVTYKILYFPKNSPKQSKTAEMPSPLNTLTLPNLKHKTKYVFEIESSNKKGTSGYPNKRIVIETADLRKASTQNIREQPLIIILGIGSAVLLLVFLNGLLTFCVYRRCKRQKLLEKAAATRLGETSANSRKILMYHHHSPSQEHLNDMMISSNAGGGGNGNDRAKSSSVGGGDGSQNIDARSLIGSHYQNDVSQRPISGYSEDDRSIRTVIEVDPSGQPLLNNNDVRRAPHAATYLLDAPEYAEEMILSNSLQRRLPVQNNLYSTHTTYAQDQRQAIVYNNGIGNGSTLNRRHFVQQEPTTLTISTRNGSPNSSPNNGDLSASDYLPPPAMGPLRSISQELNNYAPAIYTAHQQRYQQQQEGGASLRHNGSMRRYSPSHQPSAVAQSPRLPTMVHYHQQQNGKSAPPYAEVRPVVMNSHHQSKCGASNNLNGGAGYCNGNNVGSTLSNNNNLKISPNSQQISPVLSTFTTTTTPSCNNGNYCSVAKLQQSTVRPDYMDLVDCLPGDLV